MAGARLISSASTSWAKIGPGRNSGSLVRMSSAVCAGDVARQHVGRELDAGEVQPGRGRQRAGGERLGHAGHVVEEHVPAGEQAGQHEAELGALAHDGALDLVEQAVGGRGGGEARLALQVGGGGPGTPTPGGGRWLAVTVSDAFEVVEQAVEVAVEEPGTWHEHAAPVDPVGADGLPQGRWEHPLDLGVVGGVVEVQAVVRPQPFGGDGDDAGAGARRQQRVAVARAWGRCGRCDGGAPGEAARRPPARTRCAVRRGRATAGARPGSRRTPRRGPAGR